MSQRSNEQLSMADGLCHRSIGVNEALLRIGELIDWQAMGVELEKVHDRSGGAPSYPALLMFKALLLQQWYQLSDPGLEQALSDRLSFRRFVGLSLEEGTPDHSTLWRFRELLGQSGLQEPLFGEIEEQLQRHGLLLKRGTLIDATLVQAQARPPKEGKQSNVDPDARFGGNQGSIFGYKAHIGVDEESLLIRRYAFSAANVNDTERADELICSDEGAVYADKAYDTHARRARLRALKIKPRIMHRPNKHHPQLPQRFRQHNALIAPRRSAVETLFAIFKRHYGYRRVKYFNARRNAVQFALLCMAVNLRRMLVLTG